MSDTQAERENDDENDDGSLVDNLIVHCAPPNANGGTLIELRLRVVDPEQVARFKGIDIEWSPETKDWVLSVSGGLTLTETAVVDIEGTIVDILDALDTQLQRDQNTN